MIKDLIRQNNKRTEREGITKWERRLMSGWPQKIVLGVIALVCGTIGLTPGVSLWWGVPVVVSCWLIIRMEWVEHESRRQAEEGHQR